MKQLQFAIAMEATIRKETERILQTAPPELAQSFALLDGFQDRFEAILNQALSTNVDIQKYPQVDPTALLGADKIWQENTCVLGERNKNATLDLIVLWEIHTLVEKSGQFYHQAALNSAHPSTRLFFSSLAEIKSMLKRRIDSLLRAVYNEVWTEVGFAPFVLGKD